jgi:hypothetical protein
LGVSENNTRRSQIEVSRPNLPSSRQPQVPPS